MNPFSFGIWEAISKFMGDTPTPKLRNNRGYWDRGCNHGHKQPQRVDASKKRTRRKMAKKSRQINRQVA